MIDEKIGDYQKAEILYDLVSDYYYYQIEAIKQGLLFKDHHVKFLDTFVFDKIVESNFILKKKLFTLIGDFYIELFRLDKLDLRFLYPNFLAAIGRGCANKFHLGNTYKETLNYIIEVFKYLKTEFESDQKNNNNLYQLKLDFISFKKFHEKNTNYLSGEPKPATQIDTDLLKRLDEIIISFQNNDKPQLEMGQGIIEFK